MWKAPDAGKDWTQEEKGMTEDEMVGWHHRLNGPEFESTPGVDDGQGGLACCSPWGPKESDPTERLNWPESLRNTSSIPSGYQLLNCPVTLLLTHVDQGLLLPLCYTVWNSISIPQPQTSYEFQMKRIILPSLQQLADLMVLFWLRKRHNVS